jgi:hypothetical protein
MHKRRGKRLIVGTVTTAAAAAVVCFGLRDLGGPAHRINPYTALKLRVGMTQARVEALFATPPGDYSSGPKADRPPVDRRPDLRREDWASDEGGAAVYFGPDDRVADFTVWVAGGRRTSGLERLRKWWYWLTVW